MPSGAPTTYLRPLSPPPEPTAGRARGDPPAVRAAVAEVARASRKSGLAPCEWCSLACMGSTVLMEPGDPRPWFAARFSQFRFRGPRYASPRRIGRDSGQSQPMAHRRSLGDTESVGLRGQRTRQRATFPCCKALRRSVEGLPALEAERCQGNGATVRSTSSVGHRDPRPERLGQGITLASAMLPYRSM